jgi:galactokinase
MFKIVEGNTRDLADVGRFIDLINSPAGWARDLFGRGKDIFITRAPGRLDVMGGIADYSGSVVLEMPIAEATLAAVQKRGDRKLRIVSVHSDSENTLDFETDLSEIEKPYEDVRAYFSQNPSIHWASYITGVFTVLSREKEIHFQNGAYISISSDIPIGKGVSSSAAIEISTMQAICAAYGIQLGPLELAMLCQKVENLVVGAPCGVMDQVTSHCGEEGFLLELICRPARITGQIAIPGEVEFWGIDSGVRHAVSGSDYSSVRTGAFMGYRIIAHLADLAVSNICDQRVGIDDWRWHGYLSNVAPEQYEREFAASIPETLRGSDFLTEYGGTTDAVTRVDPGKTYAVKAPTGHGIYENFRVGGFSALLKTGINDNALTGMGSLMFESHASYAACGLTEPGTDRLVELVKENRDRGLYGARITGGGSGGTVAVLAEAGRKHMIQEIADRYARETGKKPYVFHGSSPGCSTFGYLRLTPGTIDG